MGGEGGAQQAQDPGVLQSCSPHNRVTCQSRGHHYGRRLRGSQVLARPLRTLPSLQNEPPQTALFRPGLGFGFFQSLQRQSVRSQACRHEALCRPERGLHFRNSRPTFPPGGGAGAALLKALFVYGSVGRPGHGAIAG